MCNIAQCMSKLFYTQPQDAAKVPPPFALTFLQVADSLVIVFQLQVTLAQEKVGLD